MSDHFHMEHADRVHWHDLSYAAKLHRHLDLKEQLDEAFGRIASLEEQLGEATVRVAELELRVLEVEEPTPPHPDYDPTCRCPDCRGYRKEDDQ